MRIKREPSKESTISKLTSTATSAINWLGDQVMDHLEGYKRWGDYASAMDVIRGYQVVCAEIDRNPYVRMPDGEYVHPDGSSPFNPDTYYCHPNTIFVFRGYEATKDNKALLFLEMQARFMFYTLYRTSCMDFFVSRASLWFENFGNQDSTKANSQEI